MFEIRNEGERATIYLYGTIGEDFWSPDESNLARDFAKELDELGDKPVDIRIDSCGGDVYEGFAIASAIGRYEGDTVAYVDGVAASAASYVAEMADRVVMSDFAQIMIHDAWTLAMGNASELNDVAARLESIDATIAGIIASRSGMGLDAVRAAMHAETWYGGQAAVDAGLADEVVETGQRMAACIDRELMARYRNAPMDEIEAAQPEDPASARRRDDPGTRTPAGASGRAGNPGAPAGDPAESHADTTLPGDRERVVLLNNRVYKI